jgi:hypothetical protein
VEARWRQELRDVEEEIVAVHAETVTGFHADQIVSLQAKQLEQRIDRDAESLH